jgi:hypothetical protein
MSQNIELLGANSVKIQNPTKHVPSTGRNFALQHKINLKLIYYKFDRLCGLVVRVLGYRSGGPGSILGTTRRKK